MSALFLLLYIVAGTGWRMLNSIVPSAPALNSNEEVCWGMFSQLCTTPPMPNFVRMFSDMHVAVLNGHNTSPNVTIWFRCVFFCVCCVTINVSFTQLTRHKRHKLNTFDQTAGDSTSRFFCSKNDFSPGMCVVGCSLRRLCRCSLHNILYTLATSEQSVQHRTRQWVENYYVVIPGVANVWAPNAFAQHNICD